MADLSFTTIQDIVHIAADQPEGWSLLAEAVAAEARREVRHTREDVMLGNSVNAEVAEAERALSTAADALAEAARRYDAAILSEHHAQRRVSLVTT